MATTWRMARLKRKVPMVHGVLLGIEDEGADPRVTRFLLTKIRGRVLPFGVDRFSTVEEVDSLCEQDFGLGKDDWEPVAEPPEFVAAVEEGAAKAIAGYLAAMQGTEPPAKDSTSAEGAD